MKLQELFEKLTSSHVINRSDLIAIMNMVEKEFGPPTVSTHSGTCLISQVCATLTAVTDCSATEIKAYVEQLKLSPSGANNLQTILKQMNKSSIQVGDKKYKFIVSANKVSNAQELKTALASGQPVIAAYNVIGTLGDCLDMIGSSTMDLFVSRMVYRVKKKKDQIEKDPKYKQYFNELKGGLVSEPLFDEIETKTGSKKVGAYHAIICFGYDSGDKAFLFRESRDLYGLKGYLKIDESLFTPDRIKTDGTSGFIHGMFYIQVDDLKIENVSK